MTGSSRNRSIPEKPTISSNFLRISARRMPRITPLSNTFSRPVSSGWNPTPKSSIEPIRPRTESRPAVGRVSRAMIFNRVLFPAPLAPTMPTASPGLTSKLTSRSAQIVSRVRCCVKTRFIAPTSLDASTWSPPRFASRR